MLQGVNINRHLRRNGCRLTLAFILSVSLWFLSDRFLPSPVPADSAYSVQVLDRYRHLLRLFTTSDGYWRIEADIKKVDPVFIEQLLAYEDKRFWSHPGVDVLAMIRAVYQCAVHGRVISGASTITMQTVRLLKPRRRTLLNKFIEINDALRLEYRMEKKEILDLYLSFAPYGGNLQGIEAASLFYFAKDASRLNPSEAALLISLPQSPETRRPDRHPQRAMQARLSVLKRLAAAGLLSEEDVTLADRSPVPEKRYDTPFLAPHLADRFRRMQSERVIFTSTLDRSLQQQLNTIASQVQQRLEKGATHAVMVVDNHSREVLAHIGSGDYFNESQIDLTRAVRSPGSTLKPFIYGLGFERGIIHPETRVLDRPLRFGEYGPENFDGTYRGWISIRQALHQSLNIPAVRVLKQVGPSRLTSRFEGLGVNLRYSGRPGLPIALGGVGCTLEDLVTLYTALANNGRYQPLHYLKDDTYQKENILLSPAAAWYLDDILQNMPFPPNVTGDADIRFKTGTSYGFRDAWAIGYNSGYTVGVWVGRPDGAYGKSGTGSSLAVPVMLQLFSALPEQRSKTNKDIQPAGVLAVSHTQLPPALRWLGGNKTAGLLQTNLPRITFPVDGSTIPLKKDAAGRPFLSLKADGGVSPLHWLIDGRPLPDGQSDMVAQYYPGGPGMTRITLIDSRGKRDRVAVWLE